MAESSKAPATQPTLRNAGKQQGTSQQCWLQAARELQSKLLRLPLQLSKIKPWEQLKRSCLDRAPDKQQAPLHPLAPAAPSEDFGKLLLAFCLAAAGARRQAPAPQSAKGVDADLRVRAMPKERKTLSGLWL